MEAATASSFKLILGSSSKARQKILAEMGYEFTVMVSSPSLLVDLCLC
uniref:Maf-like protein DDB_G0281937 n=1 Tax=Rhizophora mucronata TaxID=61149 RepID=A0A2P2KVJ2_RHIMU